MAHGPRDDLIVASQSSQERTLGCMGVYNQRREIAMNLDIQGRCERYNAWPLREADQRAVKQARANYAAAWAEANKARDELQAVIAKRRADRG